jgi:hypothetical protein
VWIKRKMFNAIVERTQELQNIICPARIHDWVIESESFQSENAGSHVDVWTVRNLVCVRCAKRIKDGTQLGFKYQARRNENV